MAFSKQQARISGGKHLRVQKDAIFMELGFQIASENGVIYESVWVGQFVEHLEGGAELDDASRGVVVGGEAELDDAGVVLPELRHRRAGVEAVERWRLGGGYGGGGCGWEEMD
ncbi:nicotinate-nucleotide--dimethylbenzimidazolephosphoribosyltransferase [Striga asiatica]|uniref:Nicotinate-nucleotide--dimethylbenzimidazolephosphoribosyltransferase n=1 Tax=Striga asiatica TaxID=4170 RepID=A0A5A7RIY8_STRAF|nr:nicotinate-nucleotide--dimethylbenzimidazolephosphoribosyltransferase [Striga asiatica]